MVMRRIELNAGASAFIAEAEEVKIRTNGSALRSVEIGNSTMPGYSEKAQPYLNAIAHGVFTSQEVRDWLIKGTAAELSYVGASVLMDEKRAVRCRIKPTRADPVRIESLKRTPPPALRATSPTMGEENKCQRYFFPPPSWGRSRA